MVSRRPASATERRRIELDAILDAAMIEAADNPRRSRRLLERIAVEGQRKKIEIYSAGCRACRNVEAMVRRIVGTHHDVEVLDMHQDHVARQAERRGVRSLPGVVVDGRLTPCCTGSRDVDEAILRSAITSRRRGDLAGAMFQAMKRQIAEKLREGRLTGTPCTPRSQR